MPKMYIHGTGRFADAQDEAPDPLLAQLALLAYEDIRAELPREPAVERDIEAERLDLVRWQRKAKDALKAGKSAAVRYVPDALDADIAEAVRAGLMAAQDEQAVKAVFDAAFTALDDADALDLARAWVQWARQTQSI